MGSGASLEDFYPSIAINSLMRILKDQSLSQHHTMAIQALGFIFKSLGVKSVPYLPQVRERRREGEREGGRERRRRVEGRDKERREGGRGEREEGRREGAV